MNATTLINEIYIAYKGKIASRTPIWGSDKSTLALTIANRKQREWAKDSNVSWRSLFRSDVTAVNQPGTVATAGTTTLTGTSTYFTDFAVGDTITVSGETVRTIDSITSDTSLEVTVAFANTDSGLTFKRRPIIATAVQEYSVHRNFYVPADNVTVKLSSQSVSLVTSKPENRVNGDIYFSGSHPQKLTFYNDIISTSEIVGGELLVPGYYVPDDLSASSDLVVVDDENWLIYAAAAELARNDTSKDSEFANLLGMANDLYRKMINANNKLGFLQGGKIVNNMPQVSASLEDWTL